MKFKQFAEWANDRACDGAWGMNDAFLCASTAGEIYRYIFFKREKKWQEHKNREYIEKLIERYNERMSEN